MGFNFKSISGSRGGRFLWLRAGWWVAGGLSLVSMMQAQELVIEPDTAVKGDAPVQVYDELAYKDGEKVRGYFVDHADGEIVFQTLHFGLIKAKDSEAKLSLAVPGKTTLQVADDDKPNSRGLPPGRGPITAFEGGYLSYLSPRALGMRLQRFFGPWHGHIAFSTELDSDTTDRNTIMAELKIGRKWANDEVKGVLRYDYSSTDNVLSTDVARLTINWRHDFNKRYFGIYNSAVEWNRDYLNPQGIQSKYLLIQQELGGGIALLNTDRNKVRTGLSVDTFEVWVSPGADHSFRVAESVFGEVESKLPWQITLTDRGIVYYTPSTNKEGFENKFDLSKKLTETISVGFRHEVRFNSPDERVTDYSLLKFIIGIDF